MRFCINCGEARHNRARFCGACGSAFPVVPASADGASGAPPAAPVAPPASPGPAAPAPPVWGQPQPHLPARSQQPAPTAGGAPRWSAAPAAPARLRTLGNWLTWLYGALAVGFVVLLVASLWQWHAWDRWYETSSGSFDEAQAADRVVGVESFHTGMAALMVLASIAIGVVFVVWLFRAARNDQLAEATGTLSPGWAIGAWFVPIGMFFLPVMVVSQAWRAMDPSLRRPVGASWKHTRWSPSVAAWWATLTTAVVCNAAAGALYGAASASQTQMNVACGLYAVAALAFFMAAAFAAAMIQEISGRHDSRGTVSGDHGQRTAVRSAA